MSDRRGLCAYAITRNGELDLGAPWLIGHRELGVVVAEIDPARFAMIDTGGTADDDLVELARTHDAVVRGVFQRAPVLPLRFGTVFADEEAAIRLLRTGYDQVMACLDEFDGHSEWGVRLRRVTPERDSHDGLSGTAYLHRRRERLAALERGRDVAARAVEALSAHASRVIERTPANQVFADFAYLVAADREALFHGEIDRLAALLAGGGMVVERTGPWPPYSFADLELGIRADA